MTLKKGLVALARQWMKFIVVTPAFKGVSLHRPTQPVKLQTNACYEHEDGLGLDNGGGLQSDTSADGAEFEFDAGIFVFFCLHKNSWGQVGPLGAFISSLVLMLQYIIVIIFRAIRLLLLDSSSF